VRLGTLSLCKLFAGVGLQRGEPSKSAKLPVNFPVNRGDELALDCVLGHPVCGFLALGAHSPKNRVRSSKGTNVVRSSTANLSANEPYRRQDSGCVESDRAIAIELPMRAFPRNGLYRFVLEVLKND
jgi:hypothetical protein